MSDTAFSPEAILGVLAEHGVRSVLIGGFAAVIHGSPYLTTDVDVAPATDRDNLRRLSDALRAMHAKIWTAGEPEGVPLDPSPESLGAVRVWNLVTDHGRLDVTFLGVPVEVASLADVIRSKEAAGRDKDRLVLPVLRRIAAETE
jgi:hypothetical protein